MSFIRKPRKFLKSLNFPGADDFDLDQDLIHSRTEPYRRVHLLHPNMFTTTVEDELTENRWLKSDPADVVMECMDLCVAVSTTLDDPGPPPATKLPDLPLPPTSTSPLSKSELDDGSTVAGSTASWRNTQSTTVASSTADQFDTAESSEMPSRSKSITSDHPPSPLLKCKDVLDSPTLPPLKEATRKKSFLGAPVAMPQRLVVPSPSMDNMSILTNTVTSPTQSEFQNLSMAALQREIMLLRNDLNFERYMKSQHLSHIGQLQRKYIKEATAEADTQNLINTNKTLKARLTKMNEQYVQLKKETLTSRSQSKKWESDLSGKVRAFRDDQKNWHGEEETLRFELDKARTDFEHLKKIVEKAEADQLRAQQRTHALEVELKDYDQMRRDLEAAQDKIMGFGDQSKDLSQIIQQRNELRNELESANLRYNSLELDRQRSVQAYERRIMELESQLHRTERPAGRPGQLPASVQQMLDSALAANNAKLANMKKMYHRLQDQKTELEMQYHELDAEHQALMGRLRNHERPSYSEKDTPVRNYSVLSSNRQSQIPESNFTQPNYADMSMTSEGYDQYTDYRRSPEYQSPISLI
jgi:predicted  nucleic acid-binding Zn-ribbon protein